MADAKSEFDILSYLDVSIPERAVSSSDPGSGSKILRLSRGATPPQWKPEVVVSPSGSAHDTPRRQLAFSPPVRNPITGVERKERPQTATAKPLSYDDWVDSRQSPSGSPRNPRNATTLNLDRLKTPEDRPTSPKVYSPKPEEPECDGCTNRNLMADKERKKQEERQALLNETAMERERLMNETMNAQERWEQLRQQRIQEYKEEMARVQEQRAEARAQHESENNRDREKIDLLRQGLDEIEFQQFAQQRKQEYIRDLMDQMDLNKTSKAQEKELERQFQSSALLSGEDPEVIARRKSEYKSILQSQIEYRKRAKDEIRQRELDEERALQEFAERKAAQAIEEQEKRKREMRRQFNEYSREEARIKEQRQQEKAEQEYRDRETLDEYIQTFHQEQDEQTREARERGRQLRETLAKQMELSATKKQLEKQEEKERPYGNVLPEKQPDLITCKSCSKDLPVTKFKGTPNSTLVKILQKYAQQSAKRSATNWTSPTKTLAPYEQVSLSTGKVANTPYYISPYTANKRMSNTFTSTI